MRILFLSLVLVPAVCAAAQQVVAPAVQQTTGSNWQHVEALPVGASIAVKARKSHLNCKLKSVTDDSLTCAQGKDTVFQRGDILSITIPRRGRSTLIATGVGAGIGAIVGAAATSCSTAQKNSFFECGFVTRPEGVAVGAVLFGVVGAPIGYFTDFSKSTVYKAQ
jgi:hypothetical protein